MQQFELVVVRPFADYQRGDRITDQSKVSEILADGHDTANNVVRVVAQPAERN